MLFSIIWFVFFIFIYGYGFYLHKNPKYRIVQCINDKFMVQSKGRSSIFFWYSHEFHLMDSIEEAKQWIVKDIANRANEKIEKKQTKIKRIIS